MPIEISLSISMHGCSRKRYELVKLIAGKAAFFESVQDEIKQMKLDISEDD